MCGIAGILNTDHKSVDKGTLERMIRIMKYRGPDDEGFYTDEFIGMGQCRLSIIDLSSSGHQPMSNADKSLWIVFNGEIYNYIELRAQLQAKGHKFISNSDTEVIIHAYQEWGHDCLNRFNGMWAFCIWDKRKKEFFCSRDRFGIKPFYYFFQNGKFAFASEIKALLELDIVPRVNDKLIYDFLMFGMLDHTDETFFKSINKLPPASFMKISKDGALTVERYWDFEVSDELGNGQENDLQYYEKFKDLFIDSVRLRLRSDVPIGSCLSGGLDSSSIVCMFDRLLAGGPEKKQKTFSSCFEDSRFDERDYIEEVAKITGTEKNYIFPTAEEFLKEIDDIIFHQDEPFAGPQIIAQWDVFKAAKTKVKILLDGQGGDENLCGYRKFYFFYLQKLFKAGRYLKFSKEAAQFFASTEIIRTTDFKNGLKYFKFGRMFSDTKNCLNEIFSEKFQDRVLDFGYNTNLGQRIKEDVTRWSLPALLRYEDKNSMAFSIESRLPFLDYRLVEYMARLPLSQKMRNGWTKFVLRQAMKGVIPEKIERRKSKLGFSTPEELWLKKNLFKNINSVFKNPVFITEYANKKMIQNYVNCELFGKNQMPLNVISRFYILELWGRRFIY
ncbi:MAG: asparagine synthase (glutamine-hydrolyzing) [Candidatus Yanofskyibacterium parasiticum]|nr:MAG: asparagine synthase (glutamine-hydrolyzing) [Candidatus Yanofskybacteria bacterium]